MLVTVTTALEPTLPALATDPKAEEKIAAVNEFVSLLLPELIEAKIGICQQCGKVMLAPRSDKRYCGDTCRYNAWAARQKSSNGKPV